MNTPTAAIPVAAIPMPSVALSLTSDQNERNRQIQTYRDTIARQYSLPTDDPTFIILDLFRFHEEFLLLTREEIRADHTEFLRRFQVAVTDELTKHVDFAGGVAKAIDSLSSERDAYLKRATLDEGERVRFTGMVEASLQSFTTFQQNLVDTNKLQLNLEAACQVLTKRAMIESILNYMLPVIGLLVGAGGMLFLLLRFGWLVQS